MLTRAKKYGGLTASRMTSRRFVPALLFVFLLFAGAAAEAAEGLVESSYADLVKGKELFDAGSYAGAVEDLKAAYSEVPVIGDYALFFMARAYNRIGKFEKSSRCIDELLKSYPDSFLRKRVRALRIRNLLALRETTPFSQGLSENASLRLRNDDTVMRELEAYVTDYPEDAKMTYHAARFFKASGRVDKAKALFLKLYTGASSYADLSSRELTASDIAPRDLLAKSSALMKAFEYKKAESLLRKLLSRADEPLKEEILKNLGHSLFRQKKYREAGEVFLKAGDLYNGARSLYRAGDLEAFRGIVDKLSAMEDKRAGTLLLAYASKKRREGKGEEALNIFNEVGEKYPALAEDALWGIAWTRYRGGRYKEAADALSTLDATFPSSRYHYWRQRCSERATLAAGPDDGSQGREDGLNDKKAGLFGNGAPGGNAKASAGDFYSLLSYTRESNRVSGRSLTRAAWTVDSERSSRLGAQTGEFPPEIRPFLERFTILRELNMNDDAAVELTRAAGRISRLDMLLYLGRTLQSVGAYKKSISLVSRFSAHKGYRPDNGAGIDDILYPLAYWPTIREVSGRYSLDPFVLLAVMREESRFDPGARSVAGALGLMQLMPQTAFSLDKKLRMDISDSSEIYNIRVNITVGAYYLQSLLKEFGSLPVALAAYNAGEDRVREWIRRGKYASHDEFIEDIPYAETRNYVKRVLATYFTYLNLEDR
ncbi:MAG: transglycosylase SLT domain-containing protein [Nitrospirae bacterium]|nr:transglycosylase SLT domain-containing protein [Nitrospirota bacterium]